MSGSLPEDQAALFVLGALNAEEMRATRIAAGRDPALAAEIADWERRLAPLARLVPEAAVPASLWTQLDARLSRISGGGAAAAEFYQPAAVRPRLRSRRAQAGRNYWQLATAGALAVAAGLAIAMIVRAPPPPAQLAMIMPAKPGMGGWLVQVASTGELRVRAVGAISHGLDQDYELWAMQEGSDRAQPIGLLPVNATAVIKSAALPKRNFKLLVSLEAKGGSISGLPGPVVYAGDVVAP